jgi:hypothetical protein
MPFQQSARSPEFRQYFLVGHPIFDPSAHAVAQLMANRHIFFNMGPSP